MLKASCNVHSKSVTVNDLRGIPISPVVKRFLEHSILNSYSNFLKLAIVNLVLKNWLLACFVYVTVCD